MPNPSRRPRQAVALSIDPPGLPHLLGLGTAVPELSRPQREVEHMMADLWNLKGSALERWRRIIAGSGIRTRHGVMRMEDVVHLTTAQRMAAYEQLAPDLAAAAARRALSNSGVQAREITDLIVVSCTGFAAPGVDVALVEKLGLERTVRRTMIGFMGCFGAISGLRTGVGACAANPGAIALVVCIELCSLHMRADRSVQNQVAAALFADGAAAAVVGSGHLNEGLDFSHTSIGQLTSGASLLMPEGKQWMSWRITDTGFAMTLTRDVPQALRNRLAEFVAGASAQRPGCFVIHPGGPGILDAADAALALSGGCGLDASWAVLGRFGNMSSATVLFVLQEAMNRDYRRPAMLLAFGPGLTIESLQLLRKTEQKPLGKRDKLGIINLSHETSLNAHANRLVSR